MYSRSSVVVRGLSPALMCLCAGLATPICATAQVELPCPAGPGQPWVGEMGITETVAQIMDRERRTPPRRLIIEAEDEKSHRRDPARILPNPAAPAVPQWPWNFDGRNPPTVGQQIWNPLQGGALDNPQTISTNQLGNQLSEAGFLPPDSVGDVGPTQVIVVANGRIKTFSKSTGLADGALNTSTNTFFNTVRNASTTSDPQVRFDKTSNRWFVVMINVTTPNRIMVAVSSGPTIGSSASFTFFFFSQDTPTPTAAGLADYPSLGVDANALYVGTNRFNGGFTATDGFVINKASVMGAGPLVVTVFRSMAVNGGHGPYAPRGVDNRDPAATVGYFAGVDTNSFSTLYFRRISTPGGTPTISANMVVTVPTTVSPKVTNAMGSTVGLDALDDRLFAAQIRRNRATGLDSLWTAHNIEVNASGVGAAGGGRNASRWYQIGNLATTPTLIQAGTLFDSSATNPVNQWIPSVNATGQGHMALGCSAAGAALQPGARTAGRLASDALGTIQAPSTIVASATSYNAQTGGSSQRWGDYSAVAVDPEDDQTMWTFQEYCNATNSWAVRLTKLLAPPPNAPTICTPDTLTQGDTNIDLTITGPSVNGSAYYDTDPSYSKRLSAAVNGGGVSVNSITFNPATPGQFIMNVTVSGVASSGSRTITVTNPDGQSATSATPILTINMATPSCYANCDNSTTDPILNVNDFQCFLNAFAIQTTYANCDLSTTDPVLNVNDFQCFLNAFAVGCT